MLGNRKRMSIFLILKVLVSISVAEPDCLKNQKMIKEIGLLFDLDGTCFYTEGFHFAAWYDLFETRWGKKINITFYNENMAGKANIDVNRKLFPDWTASQHEEFAVEKERLFREKVKKEGIRIVEGLKEFINFISVSNQWSLTDTDGSEIKLVPIVVTNAPVDNYDFFLESMGYKADKTEPYSILHPYPPFRDVFTAEQRGCRGKPFPDPYAFAVRDNGLKPENCIAFEDSPAGIQSAKSAHVKAVVGLATTHTEKEVTDTGAKIAVKNWRVLQNRYSSPLEFVKDLIEF